VRVDWTLRILAVGESSNRIFTDYRQGVGRSQGRRLASFFGGSRSQIAEKSAEMVTTRKSNARLICQGRHDFALSCREVILKVLQLRCDWRYFRRIEQDLSSHLNSSVESCRVRKGKVIWHFSNCVAACSTDFGLQLDSSLRSKVINQYNGFRPVEISFGVVL